MYLDTGDYAYSTYISSCYQNSDTPPAAFNVNQFLNAQSTYLNPTITTNVRDPLKVTSDYYTKWRLTDPYSNIYDIYFKNDRVKIVAVRATTYVGRVLTTGVYYIDNVTRRVGSRST
jgi:hypothetical protein